VGDGDHDRGDEGHELVARASRDAAEQDAGGRRGSMLASCSVMSVLVRWL
jgi:hypothetical protein